MQMKLEANVRRVTHRTINRVSTIVNGQLVRGPEIPPPVRVRIEPDPPGFLLLYLDGMGDSIADGWHLTVEEAKRQAKFEFEIEESDWVAVSDKPLGSP
jgi:hypothetical protein